MHKLKAITALGGHEPRVDTIANAGLRENPNLAIASVHARLGQEASARSALQGFLGSDAPAVGKAVFGERYSAFWTAQDQWLLCANYETDELLAQNAMQHFQGSASITEQSDAWCCFELSGAGKTSVMELLCPVNMKHFGSGDAVRTSIHHLGCFVVGLEDQNVLRILGPRASAESLHHAIITAMRAAL